jgi:hypothetical protein
VHHYTWCTDKSTYQLRRPRYGCRSTDYSVDEFKPLSSCTQVWKRDCAFYRRPVVNAVLYNIKFPFLAVWKIISQTRIPSLFTVCNLGYIYIDTLSVNYFWEARIVLWRQRSEELWPMVNKDITRISKDSFCETLLLTSETKNSHTNTIAFFSDLKKES